jgi:UDP-hydrolysing UDP-N-acetyl-D-glucosamine 2-epimerase
MQNNMNKKTLGIFSTSRAEFGLFMSLLNCLKKDTGLSYKLFVGGAHLSNKFGLTAREAENFKITETFDFLPENDNPESLARAIGDEGVLISKIFSKHSFDYTVVIGDRFELLPIINTSIIFRKPLIHIHGGEVSEGAIDEQIRHMITKAAHLHFVSCQEHYNNVINMGEEDWRIFNTGALGIDNVVNNEKISKDKLFDELNLNKNKKTVLLTYHPVTLEYKLKSLEQLRNLFDAVEKFDFQVVITAPNVEVERDKINTFIKKKVSENSNFRYIKSLGVIKYQSLIPHCEFVIGNSSSGIIEMPFFKVPTVNVGDRQKGRLRHKSVIDTGYSVDSIKNGIEKALSDNFRKQLKNMEYKFGDGNAAQKMVQIIKSIEIDERLMRKKLNFPERVK